MGVAAVVAGGATVSAIGQVIAGDQVARATEGAAKAQLAEDRRTRAMAMEAAEPSPEELAQLQQAVQTNEKDIARKQRVLDSLDPTFIAAAEQAYNLIKGQDAAVLEPLREQRSRDRQALEAKLQRQLGPDYANSAAGIRALSEFDRNTGMVVADAQDRAIGRLQGFVTTGAQMSQLTPNISNSATLGQLFGNIQNRRVNAIVGTQNQNAGANFMGDIVRGQAMGNAFSTLGEGAIFAGVFGGNGGME